MKYAVALTEQSIYSPTLVGDFIFQPNEKLHLWKGKFATSASELCQQVNEALDALKNFSDPVLSLALRVVEIEKEEPVYSLPEEPIRYSVPTEEAPPMKPVGKVRPRNRVRAIESEDLKGAFG
jgi:hypothetical protein